MIWAIHDPTWAVQGLTWRLNNKQSTSMGLYSLALAFLARFGGNWQLNYCADRRTEISIDPLLINSSIFIMQILEIVLTGEKICQKSNFSLISSQLLHFSPISCHSSLLRPIFSDSLGFSERKMTVFTNFCCPVCINLQRNQQKRWKNDAHHHHC